MSFRPYLGLRCVLCKTDLKIFEVTGAKHEDKIIPGLPSTAPVVAHINRIELSEMAEHAGWEEDPQDVEAGRVDSRWTCRVCAGRIRCMHSWIKANRIIEQEQ